MLWGSYILLGCFIVPGFAATSRPPIYADLADRARSQPPEFAADALLRIAAAAGVGDAAWKRQVIEDAFHLAASAQQPYARRNWTGSSGSLFDKAYAQGLDVCTLQCRAVHAMLEVDYRKARELFASMPPPQPPGVTCDDSLVYDVSAFYAAAGEVAARAFSPKERAEQEPLHLLQRFSAQLNSPLEAAPVARMLAGTSLKPAEFEVLVDTFASALKQVSGDERSFAAAIAVGEDKAAIEDLIAECIRRRLNAQPLQEAWQAYAARNLSRTPCDGAKVVPMGQCTSPECLQLATQFSSLVLGPNGIAWSDEQKSTTEWGARLRQYLAAVAAWQGDDPTECFQFKSRFYSSLFHMAPAEPDRDLLLFTLLTWLQDNTYQRDHRVEWFYPVNALIIRAFADPLGMKATVHALQISSDPVISLYAQLEQTLPRPRGQTIGLL